MTYALFVHIWAVTGDHSAVNHLHYRHVELPLPELQATHKHVSAVAKGSISAFKASLVCVCFPQILLLLLPCIWLLSHLHSRLKINAKQRQTKPFSTTLKGACLPISFSPKHFTVSI
ncbi:hypothetical protein P8452_39190 [Trifolium repens]|nr:hypothetical protein P8452_39190 [Trifolium repens]